MDPLHWLRDGTASDRVHEAHDLRLPPAAELCPSPRCRRQGGVGVVDVHPETRAARRGRLNPGVTCLLDFLYMYDPVAELAAIYRSWAGGGHLKAREIEVLSRSNMAQVERALEIAALAPRPCESCGSENVRPHYPQRQLRMRWSCWRCHNR